MVWVTPYASTERVTGTTTTTGEPSTDTVSEFAASVVELAMLVSTVDVAEAVAGDAIADELTARPSR